MSNTHSDAADRRFAHNLFTGSDDDQNQHVVDDDEDQDDGLDDQRRYAANLFARDDADAPVLAGLTNGRTFGRTTAPKRGPTLRNTFNFS